MDWSTYGQRWPDRTVETPPPGIGPMERFTHSTYGETLVKLAEERGLTQFMGRIRCSHCHAEVGSGVAGQAGLLHNTQGCPMTLDAVQFIPTPKE